MQVVETRLSQLRDSNPVWSGLWRLCCQWAGNSSYGGWLPNPVGPGDVSLRTWLRLLNFKANHRKTLVADAPEGWVGLVTSGNPHDAFSEAMKVTDTGCAAPVTQNSGIMDENPTHARARKIVYLASNERLKVNGIRNADAA